MKKVCLICLGCPKNIVDSENILGILGNNGYILTDTPEQTDIVILNTCAFIRDAVRETRSHIQEITSLKKKNPALKFVVAGCFSQRYWRQLQKNVAVDAIVGTGNPHKVLEAIREIEHKNTSVKVTPRTFFTQKQFPRMLLTYPYAYLKISEGCNNFCSYCIVPYLRGRLQSRKLADIVSEAKDLQLSGIKELIIIAQDTAVYGKDLSSGENLVTVLKKLVNIRIPWIRLLYAHPEHITGELLELIAQKNVICNYLDIPIQHAHPEILKRMNRPVIDYISLFEKIRKTVPGIAVRTTFMVGFPGETQKHFKYLIDFIKETKPDKAGFFAYSRETGTPAYRLSGQVDGNTKHDRLMEIAQVQTRISRKNLKKLHGKLVTVLIEGKEGNCYLGRSQWDAPEIDGLVYLKGKNLRAGDMCKAQITKTTDFDLHARLVP